MNSPSMQQLWKEYHHYCRQKRYVREQIAYIVNEQGFDKYKELLRAIDLMKTKTYIALRRLYYSPKQWGQKTVVKHYRHAKGVRPYADYRTPYWNTTYIHPFIY